MTRNGWTPAPRSLTVADLSDRIAEVLREHQMVPCSRSAVGEPTWHWSLCEGCDWESDHFVPGEGVSREDLHAAHVAEVVVAAIHPQITTREELDALPHQSLVLRPYTSQAGWKLHEVWERRNESWYCIAAPLNPPGREWGVPELPVRLVWRPSWAGVLGEEQDRD